MINPTKPDFLDTPSSDTRPNYHYVPINISNPPLSIITPYYNTGEVFEETVRSIQRMSFTNWEWIIVNDGSTDSGSLARLEALKSQDARVKVIHQKNFGPGVARNRAVEASRGKYFFQIDSDDLVEPTFVEKAIWFLETHPNFGVCGSQNVGFGTQNYLWIYGFEQREKFQEENWAANITVIRREVHLQAGGYDETLRAGHEDWDYWLNLAESGWWGYTIPEFLSWYRRQENSRIAETEGDKVRALNFRKLLHSKHKNLFDKFSFPTRPSRLENPSLKIDVTIPFQNKLEKIEVTQRVLLMYPWMEIGGADKFNLDMLEQLNGDKYEFTIVTTSTGENPWYPLFAKQTPDIFILDHFLELADYPRFISYIIESRQIDMILISNSEMAYQLLPYLRTFHPYVPVLDYNHAEQPAWKNGGYPEMTVTYQALLDCNIASTDHLKTWMIKQGADAKKIEVCHTNIDHELWDRGDYKDDNFRQELGIDSDLPVILFVGRITDEKRPRLFMEIIREIYNENQDFAFVVVGDGPDFNYLVESREQHKLQNLVYLLGAQPNDKVKRIMAHSDILLLPSANEGLALVLFESMAMEMLPVAANVGGHKELVTPDCGYLISHGQNEVQEYRDVLLELLKNPQKRISMSKNCRKRIEDHFQLKHMVEKLDHIFSHAIENSHSQDKIYIDKQVGIANAQLAIEYMRLQGLADYLWHQVYEIIPRERVYLSEVYDPKWLSNRVSWRLLMMAFLQKIFIRIPRRIYHLLIPLETRLKFKDWRQGVTKS